MKQTKVIASLCVLVCLMMMLLPTHATEMRASDQISRYSIDVSSSSSEINIEMSVRGIGTSSKIGCESIEVYEKSGSRWVLAESLDEDDPGMSEKNTLFYLNVISCDCNPGTEYKVVVTIFAVNSAGRDSRTHTYYVTGE